MERKIEKILKEKVDPVLAEHYGGAVLKRIEDNVVYVRLTGACSTCPAAQDTIEDVVKAAIMENVEGIKDVVLDNSVSDELLDIARKILKNHDNNGQMKEEEKP